MHGGRQAPRTPSIYHHPRRIQDALRVGHLFSDTSAPRSGPRSPFHARQHAYDLPYSRRALTGPYPSRSILATNGSRSAWETLASRAPDSRVSTTKRFLRVGRFTRECSCQARPLRRKQLTTSYMHHPDPHIEAAGERLDDPITLRINLGEPTYIIASSAPSSDVVQAYAARLCFCEGGTPSSRLCVDLTTHRNPG